MPAIQEMILDGLILEALELPLPITKLSLVNTLVRRVDHRCLGIMRRIVINSTVLEFLWHDESLSVTPCTLSYHSIWVTGRLQ